MDAIQTYIQNQRAAGASDEEIKTNLANNGHSDTAIKNYFDADGSSILNIDSETKLYSYWNLAGGAFIGGPLAVAYMVQKNFEAWGEQELAKESRKWGFLLTIAVFVCLDMVIYFLPEDSDTSFGFVVSAVAFGLASHYQGERLKSHKEQNGLFIGLWKTLGVALVGMLATLLLALVTFTAVYAALSGLGFTPG